jgi:4-diphosphocytidyl-2-C-methyl-D-erythritol kinase
VRTVDGHGRAIAGLDGSQHLALRAAAGLRERYRGAPGVHLDVVKNIPIAAGMAGGSADAAAALVACAAAWRLDVPPAEVQNLAAALGSDVPFAVAGGTAVGTGRGERVRPVAATVPTHWVMVSSTPGLSTPAVYAAADHSGHARPASPAVDPRLLGALASGDRQALAGLLHNDLQAPALSLRPGLADVLAAGTAAGALAGIVSGSGPTLLLLIDGADAAAVTAHVAPVAAAVLADARVRTISGPVPGARLR